MEKGRCRICGGLLAGGAAGGMCARCLFGTALAEIADGPAGEAPDADRMGELLEGYEFLGEIGRGGMGAVHEALERGSGRRVAVKVLSPAAATNAEFVERFRREAEVLSGLRHPRIVEVITWGERAGILYLVMEFVPGGDLAELLAKRGRLPLDEAAGLIGQACEALEFTHAKGVLHRDIKPGNLLLDGHGGVKLGDFGLAKVLGDGESMGLTLTRASMGTPRYMAPEQMGTGDGVDARTDVYALGVVFYEMLTGSAPGGNFALPSERSEVGERVDEVVLRAMSDTKDGRYPTVAEFHRAVRGLGRRTNRRTAIAVMGLAAAGAAAMLMWKRGGERGGGSTWEFAAVDGGELPAGYPERLAGVRGLVLSDGRREFGLALMADGSLRGFGDDSYGQASPPPGAGFVAVAVGRGERAAHGVALRGDGSVAAWGDDSFGQARVPPDLARATAVAAGEFHSAARLENGEIRRWGRIPDGDPAEHFTADSPVSARGRSVEARRLD